MPWRNTAPMDQRTQLITDHLRETQTITELCDRYGVSRKTGYKWIDRYLRLGLSPSPSRPESDRRRDRGRDPGGSPSAPRLGRQEAAGAPPAAAPAVDPPGPLDGLRHPESARARPHAPPAPPHRPSRQAHDDHGSPECGVVRGL